MKKKKKQLEKDRADWNCRGEKERFQLQIQGTCRPLRKGDICVKDLKEVWELSMCIFGTRAFLAEERATAKILREKSAWCVQRTQANVSGTEWTRKRELEMRVEKLQGGGGGEGGRSWYVSQDIERTLAFTLSEKGSLWKVLSTEVPRSDLGLKDSFWLSH